MDCIQMFPHNILSRDNALAHITSSGFILNQALDKALFVHHNIRNTWAWTGGHADDNPNLLEVATQEATEETGISVTPISKNIASIDILPVSGHIKNGKYINSHLHLSIAYLFVANEDEPVTIKSDENSGVEWLPINKIECGLFTDRDVYLYKKLIEQANTWLA